MITFDGIRKIYEEEKKSSVVLAKLPDSFFEEIKTYIRNKQRAVSEGESSDELETAKRRLDSIFELRERKIINSALDFVRSEIEPQNLFEDEERLFRAVVDSISRFREDMAQKLAPVRPKSEPVEEIHEENPEEEQKPPETVQAASKQEEKSEEETKDDIVDFKDDMHEFMGTDLKPYGPFKKGDIASVPPENAKVIEKLNKGVVIRSSEAKNTD